MFYNAEFLRQMGVQAAPRQIHHYTSIESLAAILEHRTIRFRRLDLVNDPEEASAKDLARASSAVFAASFTAEDEESIPMWKMYGGDFRGVRISLPPGPFNTQATPVLSESGGFFQDLDSPVIVRRAGLGPFLGHRVFGPNPVHYSNNDEFRHTQVFKRNGKKIDIELHDLGIVKQKPWSYEKEWRFRIFAGLRAVRIPDVPSRGTLWDFVNAPVEDEHIDVPLAVDLSSTMQVTVGPLVLRGSKQDEEVRSLIKKFAHGVKVGYSDLKIRAQRSPTPPSTAAA